MDGNLQGWHVYIRTQTVPGVVLCTPIEIMSRMRYSMI